MNKKNLSKDAIAEAKKDKRYQKHSETAKVRIRLAVEVFKHREEKGLTQQVLAKTIGTTQKVVSRIENAEVNIGIDLLNRIAESLNFTSEDLAKIFNCSSTIFSSLWLPEAKSKEYVESIIIK
ncbi:helix-turn-helix transcriptional regulator [Patescibacteria group bacterium AH-259-L07]|nr:helix-turn-helix transcriptional regulator [Patescibacteria group bacterium AH-259-L07]